MPAFAQALILGLAAVAVGAWLVAVYSALRLWRALPRGRARWRLIWDGMAWFKAETFPAAAANDRRRLLRAFGVFFAALVAMALLAALLIPGR